MCDHGSGFPAPAMRQLGKKIIRKRAGDVSKGIAIEKEKRSTAMAGAKKVQCLSQSGF